ncbi:conserved hypothetical protein [Methanolacinia petrolearia DSM 11571]|uniref:Uncharacterized protein n=1 Tax=Methanolacinia petrolearia (strain DSM 11571 / OCM 486 / SEBR 4847) TaxID=679926 RepID=E1RFG5_METP4|nr:hypothetical protein [Methanolacinia petrolearia]ADN36195.1 conserved hypothetical protein [Methanolacinia petrolearia DSM 11571]
MEKQTLKECRWETAFSGMKISEHSSLPEESRDINNHSMSRKIKFLIITAIILALLVGHANAVPHPLPGEGNQILILYMIHPNAKNNEEITSFLAEHPNISWRESVYNETYDYIYITPLNDCREKLVYINQRKVDERNEPSIVSVRIIGCDKILPLDPLFQFPEIFENYSSLSGDQDLMDYIEENIPGRCAEVERSDSETDVYFIDDTGTFTEYIVTIEKGLFTDDVVYSTFISEDYFTINKSEAQAEALGQRPGWNLTGETILKINDDVFAWEIPVSNGSGEDTIIIPAELREGYSVMKTEPKATPGFDLSVTILGIGAVLVLIARRRN